MRETPFRVRIEEAPDTSWCFWACVTGRVGRIQWIVAEAHVGQANGAPWEGMCGPAILLRSDEVRGRVAARVLSFLGPITALII